MVNLYHLEEERIFCAFECTSTVTKLFGHIISLDSCINQITLYIGRLSFVSKDVACCNRALYSRGGNTGTSFPLSGKQEVHFGHKQTAKGHSGTENDGNDQGPSAECCTKCSSDKVSWNEDMYKPEDT